MFDKMRLISQLSTVSFDGLDYHRNYRINCYILSVILRDLCKSRSRTDFASGLDRCRIIEKYSSFNGVPFSIG